MRDGIGCSLVQGLGRAAPAALVGLRAPCFQPLNLAARSFVPWVSGVLCADASATAVPDKVSGEGFAAASSNSAFAGPQHLLTAAPPPQTRHLL